jgi:hypothetical protein
MNLSKVIAELVKAQDNFDSVAYANCFSDTAVVFDEGKTHNGRTEIQHWIAEANEKYKTVMKPIGFTKTDTTSVLSAEISGTFDGSPIVLEYYFEIIDGLIQSLKITG